MTRDRCWPSDNPTTRKVRQCYRKPLCRPVKQHNPRAAPTWSTGHLTEGKRILNVILDQLLFVADPRGVPIPPRANPQFLKPYSNNCYFLLYPFPHSPAPKENTIHTLHPPSNSLYDHFKLYYPHFATNSFHFHGPSQVHTIPCLF